MKAPASSPLAWEPLTPRGVASFARAPARRLWLVQFLVAWLAAGSVVWFLEDGWFPTVRAAIEQLPPAGQIRFGKLAWPDDSPRLLAEGRFLAFSVDPRPGGNIRSPAHVQVEFGPDGFRVYSLFGFSEFRYPAGWIIPFNRTDLEPWWGAWQPEILALVVAGIVVGLPLLWSIWATLYLLPAWLAAFYANRDLDGWGSWRLAGAALMPGALLMVAAILAYLFGGLDLVGLLFVAGAHLVLGWLYLFVSLWFLPRHPAAARPANNPFV